MADTYQFKLKNNTSGKEIKFYHGSGVSDTISINSVNFAVPGKSVEDNITMNLGGFTKLVTFSFILEADGTDVSTTSDEIVTLEQQWGFVMDNTVTNNSAATVTGIVQNPGSGNSVAEITYTITIYYINSNGVGTTKTYTGMLEDIAIEPVEGEPRLRGRLTLNVAGTNPFS